MQFTLMKAVVIKETPILIIALLSQSRICQDNIGHFNICNIFIPLSSLVIGADLQSLGLPDADFQSHGLPGADFQSLCLPGAALISNHLVSQALITKQLVSHTLISDHVVSQALIYNNNNNFISRG